MTNGVVSILVDGKMAMKITVGCDGSRAEDVSDLIKLLGRVPQILEAAEMCRIAGLGCSRCRVIQTPDEDFIATGEPLGSRYRETFSDPAANPRWQHQADHTILLHLSGDFRVDRYTSIITPVAPEHQNVGGL